MIMSVLLSLRWMPARFQTGGDAIANVSILPGETDLMCAKFVVQQVHANET
jgi:hypothetical protein